MTMAAAALLWACKDVPKQPAQTFAAGFKILQGEDTSRLYKPAPGKDYYLYYRPVEYDVWYPATPAPTDTALQFYDLLHLLEVRANYFTASDIATGATQMIAQSIVEELGCSDSTKLLHLKTASFKNAPFATGKFPVILYLASYNGMGYENYSLFERLAKQGYIVVAVSSIGRFPGDMTVKEEDLMEQVNDGLYAIKMLKDSAHFDMSKLVVMGYSWGSLAGAVALPALQNVACFVSLDGSEFHVYNQNREEDVDFELIRMHRLTDTLAIPYLRLSADRRGDSAYKKHAYAYLQHIRADKQVVYIDSADHGDFSSYPNAVHTSGNCTVTPYYETVINLVSAYLNDRVKGQGEFTPLLGKLRGAGVHEE